jgi:hypothetical protein
MLFKKIFLLFLLPAPLPPSFQPPARSPSAPTVRPPTDSCPPPPVSVRATYPELLLRSILPTSHPSPRLRTGGRAGRSPDPFGRGLRAGRGGAVSPDPFGRGGRDGWLEGGKNGLRAGRAGGLLRAAGWMAVVLQPPRLGPPLPSSVRPRTGLQSSTGNHPAYGPYGAVRTLRSLRAVRVLRCLRILHPSLTAPRTPTVGVLRGRR